MPRSIVRGAGCAALIFAVVASLLTAASSPSHALTTRQKRVAYVKKVYRLPLPDFLVMQRHWWPIQKAHGGPAASHHADWSTDGCSGGGLVWSLINAEFQGAKWDNIFRNACIRHDFGYRNFGKGRPQGLAYVSTPAQRKAVDSRLSLRRGVDAAPLQGRSSCTVLRQQPRCTPGCGCAEPTPSTARAATRTTCACTRLLATARSPTTPPTSELGGSSTTRPPPLRMEVRWRGRSSTTPTSAESGPASHRARR